MRTIQDDILERIRGQGRGKVFTPKDFLDLGSRDAADQSLSRLVKGGEIQRLGRGLYHFPRMNERLGIALGPDLDEIAEALARQTGSRVVPSGGGGKPARVVHAGAGQASIPDGRPNARSADRQHDSPASARRPERIPGGMPDECDGVPGTAAPRAGSCRYTGSGSTPKSLVC